VTDATLNKYAQFSKAPKRPRRGSPKDIIRFRKCSLKVAYRTKEDAQESADKQLFGNRPYRCPFCKLFHLSSK
jgi:hypothetical protein